MKTFTGSLLALVLSPSAPAQITYPIVDTAQVHCYDDSRAITYPKAGEAWFGQDAQFHANEASYKDNGDGTVSDLVTRLMWTKGSAGKVALSDAMAKASECRVGGHEDWRMPNIKELYSLIQFDGFDPGPEADPTNIKPFIDHSVFEFYYGDTAGGDRIIDSQFASSTIYTSTTMRANKTMFGVNFADGRIKGYPAERVGPRIKTYHVLYVRGNPDYGKNKFVDNGDGTITDHASGLTWTKADSGKGLNWQEALKHAEDLKLGGHGDWRLPNAKELQSIVDYTRSPGATESAAIDPVFQTTAIKNEGGEKDYGQYWTSTTHVGGNGGRAAVYVAFGRAGGFMGGRDGGPKRFLDVHGAGAQRSDPKAGDASRFPEGRGPQGDVIRIDNLVRCVRGGGVKTIMAEPEITQAERRPDGGPGRRPGGGDRPAGGGNHFLDRFDRNGDQKVTREEFDGPPRRFGMIDKDGDGVVTSEEAAAAPAPPGRRGSEQGARPDSGRGSRPGAAPARPPQVPAEASGAKAKPAPSGKPNLILILADDMGWTGLSVGMDDRIENSSSDFYQTPRIAELAEQGMRFSQAYSPGSLCTPTRASILTGKTPAKIHITTPGGGGRSEAYHKLSGARQLREFPASETTVAEALKEVGYATAHLGKWHLPTSDPGDHGFDVHDGSTANHGPGAFEDPNPKDVFGITGRAITFIENQVDAGRPFYLQLSHFAVHAPTLARATSIAKFEKLSGGERHTDVEYAAMTHDLDSGVGVLLDKIDAMGLTKTTYIVFMSDNGAPGGRRRPQENLPLRGGKGGFYEGGIRVPLIVRGPGIEAGSTCRTSVIGYDLLPTFCALASAPQPDGVEGADLTPLLHGRPGQFERTEPALLFHHPHYGQGPQVPESAIIIGDYKLIKKYESGSLELYNLTADISEANELSEKEPVLLAKAADLLARRLEAAKAQMPTQNPDYDPEAARPRPRGQAGRRPDGGSQRGGRRG